MKGLGCLTWLVFVLTIPVKSAIAGGDDPFCFFRTVSPLDTAVAGSTIIDAEWRIFKFVKPLKVGPHLQNLEFHLDSEYFEFADLSKDERFKHLAFASLPSSKPAGQVHLIEAKVHNSLIGWVGLSPSSNAWPKTKGRQLLSMGYSLMTEQGHYYFPKNSVITEVQVRSNSSTRVEGIYWEAGRYSLNPCRNWKDVDPRTILSAASN